MNQQRDTLRDLIASEAQAVAPPPDARERGWARLTAAVEAGTAPRAELLAPAIHASIPWKLFVALGLIVGALAVALAGGWQSATDPPPASPVILPASPAPVPPTPVVPPIAAPAEVVPTPPEVVSTPAVASESKPTANKPAVKRRSSRGTEDNDDFAAELRLISGAQAALRDGDTVTALKRLKSHAHDYPAGHFVQDREALWAMALCASGSRKGERLAASFLAAYPDSIHADRVRTACAR